MDILFLLVGALTTYFNYRNSKAQGNLVEKVESAKDDFDFQVQNPLPENATRLERLAHWLGIEEI